jgi:hypothetical protein
MNTIIECNPSRIIILRSTFLVAALALVPAALNSAAAQDNRPSTPVTVEEPLAVEVQGPVEVQGVVEVINDVLRQPFVQSVNVPSAGSPTANFDIPDGKRLVIESIAFQASRPSNETNRMFLQPLVSATQRQLVPLPVQFISVEGAASYLISLLPLKLRLDSVPGSDNEVQIRRGTGGNGTLNASIFGYLVDI